MLTLTSPLLVRWIFFLVLLGSATQLTRGIDLNGYLVTVRASAEAKFLNPPYPKDSAQNGDYFQSPLTTLLLFPFTLIPALITKVIFAALATSLLFFLMRALGVAQLALSSQFFLILLFAHALSDVYLALNPLFLCLGFLWLFHSLSQRARWVHQACAGFLFALALFIRPIPILLIPFLFLSKEKRRVLPWVAVWLAVGLGASFLFFPDALNWWKSWFLSLGLYTQAANVMSPSFQSPAAAFSKWLSHLDLSLGFLNSLEKGFVLATFSGTFVLALRAERHQQRDLAWALLLSTLYICFSRIWISGFFYCFPLLVLCLKQKKSAAFNLLAVIYALLPQWLYPREIWNTMMSEWAVQGLVIFALLIGGLNRARRSLRGPISSHS